MLSQRLMAVSMNCFIKFCNQKTKEQKKISKFHDWSLFSESIIFYQQQREKNPYIFILIIRFLIRSVQNAMENHKKNLQTRAPYNRK